MLKAIDQSLYCLTSDHSNDTHAKQILNLSKVGIKLIQVRSKNSLRNSSPNELSESIQKAKSFGSSVILNDSVDLVAELNADGVHLGTDDCDPLIAREILGDRKVIGSTVHSLEGAESIKEKGVSNYIGIGPIRKSKTKKDLVPKLSLQKVKEIVSFLHPIPSFLIGGLTHNDFQLLRKTGAIGICVCSSLSTKFEFGANLKLFLEEKSKYDGRNN
tara:strand:- start:59 stop:706 length:648 start_codon:yes stop_codon:yes gene_type:complete